MDWKSRKGKAVIALISLGVLLPLIGNLLSTRKYPSQQQAKAACDKWADKGNRINYLYEYGYPDNVYLGKTYRTNRECKAEESTYQYLGLQGVFNDEDKAKERIQLTHDTIPKAVNLKVIKNFYF
ncbi:hypothetical protein N9A81_01190 [Synechococcus sp. AH-707-M23]|nr:hypothetical protein [Synechococcus sp. AH-707-M23]